MRRIVVALFILAAPLCRSQTDTMFVLMADGNLRTYLVSSIRELTFGGRITSVKENEIIQNIIGTFALHQNYPNPFNPSTTIEFELPYPGLVEVGIYDIHGSLVCTICRTQKEPGRHQVIWNGRNGEGNPVASGAYFCQVRFGGTMQSSKLVLLK